MQVEAEVATLQEEAEVAILEVRAVEVETLQVEAEVAILEVEASEVEIWWEVGKAEGIWLGAEMAMEKSGQDSGTRA